MLRFEELDTVTRKWMLEEFKAEESSHPYRSPSLSKAGQTLFPIELDEAIREGDDESLAKVMSNPLYWVEFEPSPLGGVRRTEPAKAALDLARQEFNTWYVRGLARRLLGEGEEFCQVYLAEDEVQDDDCTLYQNKVFRVRFVYNGHRAKYWPKENREAFSIPCGPACRHTIRRLPADMKAMIDLESRQFGAAFRRR
jgi:hypothetical protein